MNVDQNIVDLLFGTALVVNAIVFLPQIIKVLRRKTSHVLSILTLGGWIFLQLTLLFYGIVNRNYLLALSCVFSLLTCIVVVILISRKPESYLCDVAFADILEQLPGNIYWKDKQGVYLGGNKNSCSNFGAPSLADFVGKTDRDLLSEQDASVIMKADQEIMSVGKSRVFAEEVFVGPKRTLYLSHKVPLRNQRRQIVGLLGVSLDITVFIRQTLDKLETLESIIAIMPGHVYWMDKEGIYLGCNDNQAKSIGFDSRQEIIGKRNTEIRGFMIPEVLDPINKEVMGAGKTIVIEEPAILNDGTEATFVSTKAPIYNYKHEITGMVGISIDITNLKIAEKETERLKFENELQKTKLQEQERFRIIVEQVAHDIRSPLASLSMVVESCKSLPETERISLREIAANMSDIANNLLSRYKTKSNNISSKKTSQHILVSLALLEGLSEKKYQYKNLPVKFNYFFAPETSFAFIKIDASNFNRMISNLINNSVESFEGKAGVVDIKLGLDEKKRVKITLQDNGKGMSKDIVSKILNNISVTSGKKYGSGIGFAQVRNTLQSSNGKMLIESQTGKGTKIVLTFPSAESVAWIAKKVRLNKGDTVVILDDDSSIHVAWETRFKPYKDIITVKHFRLGEDAIKFIRSMPVENKIFLLSDFELINQPFNGLQIIEQLQMHHRAVLVTSHYANQSLYNLATQAKIRILPKQLATDVPIDITIEPDNRKKVDWVVVDDVKMFADSLARFFRNRDLVVDVYYNPRNFLDNLTQYAKDTKICLDNDFREQVDGFTLAKELYAAGYTKLYMFSGSDFKTKEMPNYLTVLRKGDMDALNELIH